MKKKKKKKKKKKEGKTKNRKRKQKKREKKRKEKRKNKIEPWTPKVALRPSGVLLLQVVSIVVKCSCRACFLLRERNVSLDTCAAGVAPRADDLALVMRCLCAAVAILQELDEVGKTLVDWQRWIVHCVLTQHP